MGERFPARRHDLANSREILERETAGVPEIEKRKMLHDNIVEFLRL